MKNDETNIYTEKKLQIKKVLVNTKSIKADSFSSSTIKQTEWTFYEDHHFLKDG